MKKMTPAFYNRDSVTVARDLLGKHLVRILDGVELIGKIVEVEAYLGPHDPASHAAKGITPRTKVLYGPAGHAYVYAIFGKYHCMNVVTGPGRQASSVLIRSLEPVSNIHGRTRGPGLLCAAMHIDRQLNACDLTGNQLYISADTSKTRVKIVHGMRIGLADFGSWSRKELRFFIKDNPFVS